MADWGFTSAESLPGVFQVILNKPGGRSKDVTFFRGAPTGIDSYSNGDPFGDAACVLKFPGISGFDDLDSQDVGSWLADFSDVNIYFKYGYPVRDLSFADTIDPITQQQTMCTSIALAALCNMVVPAATDSSWGVPLTLAQNQANPPNLKAGYPTSWPDSTAYWLWPGPYGPAQSDHPFARGLFTTTFTLPSSTAVTLYLTGDDKMQAWMDNNIIYSTTDSPQYWHGFCTVSMTLAAGTHELTAIVVNRNELDFVDGEGPHVINPGGYLFSLKKDSDNSIIVNSNASSTKAIRVPPQRIIVWEGFVASMEVSLEQSSELTVQCQGALYQADRYLQKPAYPPRPIPHEKLMQEVFSHTKRPHLRTQQLTIRFPSNWTQVVPPYTYTNAYTLDARPGTKYTGYSSRNTGSWDHALTNFCADLLSVMFVDEKSGSTPGNQWTIVQEPRRKPVLKVRDRFRTPDFSIWYGQVGVTGSFTRDNTQITNVVYGEGTSVDGSVWRNAYISNDGTRTEYAPLAWVPNVYPFQNNAAFDKTKFTSETLYKYGSGFGQDQATSSAKKSLTRDQSPGWTGEIVLAVDPGISKWAIRAGMTLSLKGFAGTGEDGVRFHIAQVQASPEQGTVTLTLDTRYRDLLNLEEARARTRDPLTPSKMLQINKRTVMIEDTMAPWDYTAGSGFIPQASTKFHAIRNNREVFPWKTTLKAHPPRRYASWYIKCNADRARRVDRWSGVKPIYMGQKGTIRRTEIVACDIDGNILPVEFHVSFYRNPGTCSPLAMPRDGQGPSPFIENAFQTTDANGVQLPVGSFLAPSPDLLIGWGNLEQPAGYFPSRKTDGASPTGLLVDEASWTWDCNGNGFFTNQYPGVGHTIPKSAFQIYAEFYVEHTEPVYFMGRLYRQEPGT